jgi:hypothetical protein
MSSTTGANVEKLSELVNHPRNFVEGHIPPPPREVANNPLDRRQISHFYPHTGYLKFRGDGNGMILPVVLYVSHFQVWLYHIVKTGKISERQLRG